MVHIPTPRALRVLASLTVLVAMLCVSVPAKASTGTTGETTWVNGDFDPATTNLSAPDANVGCPTTINVWQINTPTLVNPTYFHVDSIVPTDDPFVHASGMSTTMSGDSTPRKIATIQTATMIQSAKGTGQPLDPTGRLHYRLVFDTAMTSTVDFWLDCHLTPPPPDFIDSPAAESPSTGTTPPDTANKCPRLVKHKTNDTTYYDRPAHGKVRLLAWATKSSGVNRIVVWIKNGQHIKTYGTTTMKKGKIKLDIRLDTHKRSIWGKRSWKRAHFRVRMYRACGTNITTDIL